jgi:uncharacterized tellurite resistance protein B-like protein
MNSGFGGGNSGTPGKGAGAELAKTLQQIFTNGGSKPSRPQIEFAAGRKIKADKKQLELALTVLLVDMASADQNFNQEEYTTIASALTRTFGTHPKDIRALINQAQLVIKNLRGTTQFAELLRDALTQEDREKIMEVIDEVISADGKEDPFETFLRHKFADILEVTIKPLSLK